MSLVAYGLYIGVAFAVKVECERALAVWTQSLYVYGEILPQRGKNREKVKFFLYRILFLLCVYSIILCFR